ncbi:tetratricopeptide repeat protein [Tahibacter aquaticus]|uniref:Tetratricopeptide repeat protein n=2 Tax=Tahibacter aquaticus TaxID=520092 RepID=A0A4R6Z510_9GAMM|nr:tetratricopeptide repeat protein [Tahibacter aquaticus]
MAISRSEACPEASPLARAAMALALLVFTIMPVLTTFAEAAEHPVLSAGSRVARSVPGDSEDRLLIDAAAGPLVVVVEQRGIDVVVRCDKDAHDRNSPSGPWSSEIVVVAERCLLTVRARSLGAPTLDYRARAFALESDEGKRWPRVIWEQWAQAYYDSGADDAASLARALAKLREVERVVAARGSTEELRFLQFGNAVLLRRMDKHEEALAAYDTLMRGLDPQSHTEWLTRANNGKGLSLRELDRLDEADRAFADAVRYGRDRKDPYEWVSAKNNRCLVLHSYGKLAAARDCYIAVIPEFRTYAPNHVAAPMLNLAAAADTLGEPNLALKNYRAALELRRGSKDRSNVGLVLLNLANYESKIGAWPDALEHSLEAQQIFEALGDRLRTVYVLNLRGLIYSELREPARAREYLEQAVRVAQESGDRGAIARARSALALIETDDRAAAAAHREVAEYYVEIGRNGVAGQEWMLLAERLDALGDTAGRDAALAACEAQLKINAGRSYQARVATLRGRVALRTGDLVQARHYAQQAIEWRSQTREIDGLSAARLLLARIARRAGDDDAALTEIERALGELQRGERVPSSPVLAANLYDRRIELLDEAMEILLGRDVVRDAALQQAWTLKWKYARAPDATAKAPVAAGEVELLDELRAKVMQLSGKQNTGSSVARTTPPDVLTGIAQRVEVIESQLDARRAHGAESARPALGLAEIRASLGPDDVVVGLSLGARASGAWVSTATATRWVTLPGRAELIAPIKDVVSRQDRSSFEQLSTVLAPLLIAVGHSRRVLIVPDGPSYLIPFAALRKPDGELWVEHSSIELLSRPPSLPSQLLPAGLAPEFPVVVWGSEAGGRFEVAQQGGDPIFRSGIVLADLPAVSVEMRSMKRVLGGRRVFSGDPRAVASPSSTAQWMLHVAGHGIASGMHPYAAALALPASVPGSFTFVTGHSLQFGDRPPTVVFVNVCEGLSGRLFETQPPTSLASLFLQVGASAVIAASWPIDDSRAARFAEQVYSELDRSPVDLGEAVARAQREALRSGGTRHMRNWAGYSVLRTGG